MRLATNALLAQHTLSDLDLTDEMKAAIMNEVIQILKSGLPGITTEAAIQRFSRLEIVQQFNLVAMALNNMGIPPLVIGEEWANFRNPFRISVDEIDIEAVQLRLRSQQGLDIFYRQPLLFTSSYTCSKSKKPTYS